MREAIKEALMMVLRSENPDCLETAWGGSSLALVWESGALGVDGKLSGSVVAELYHSGAMPGPLLLNVVRALRDATPLRLADEAEDWRLVLSFADWTEGWNEENVFVLRLRFGVMGVA